MVKAKRWGMKRGHANRLIGAVGVIDNLDPIGSKPQTESQTRPLTQLEPEEQREVWQEVTERAEAEGRKVTAKAVQTAVDEKKDKPHVAHNSGNNEWYTPEKFIEAARTVMGSIDTDPASCALANETVKATCYYSAAEIWDQLVPNLKQAP